MTKWDYLFEDEKEHKWHRPSTEEEKHEIRDRAKDLGVSHKHLADKIRKGKIAPLEDKHWKAMENTDSWGTTKMSHVKKVAKGYGKNWEKVHQGYKKGHSMAAPMVVHRKKKRPYLVGGNTRLMVARAHKIRPHVVHVHLDD